MGFDPGQILVFRRELEEYNSEFLRPSFKSKHVNIMVWGCFAWNRLDLLIVCESGGIGSEEYIKILSKGLFSFVDNLLHAEDENTIRIRLPGDLIFMHNDAPCHKAPDTMRFLEKSDLQVMISPA